VEALVPLAALGVEDPQLRPPPRRPVAAPGDERFGPLADDIPTQPDPARPPELEAEPGRFRDRGRETGGEARRLEGDEERLGPAGERSQASQPVGDLRRGRAGDRMGRQIDDEDVDRSGGQEHPGDRQPFVEGLGCEDDEPVETDAASGGLDRVERAGEVQPGDDGAVGLRLGNQPEGERGGAGARRALQRHAGVPRQAQPTRPDDRIELREAGPDDPLDASSRLARGRGNELGWVVERLDRQRRGGQRPDHPRSCSPPPRLERRQSRRDVRGKAGHRRPSIEHLFDIVNDDLR